MKNPNEANDALKGITGMVIGGREVRVELSTGERRGEKRPPRDRYFYCICHCENS